MNPDDIRPGSYITRDGHHASVWNAVILHNERVAWKGTIREVGLQMWERDGSDAFGNTQLDLVAIDAGQS